MGLLGGKSEAKKPPASDTEMSDAGFASAAQDCFDAVKEDDFEGFKLALRAAIEAAQDEAE